MAKITQVEKQKKNVNRYNIYLDGEFGFGADEDTVVNQRLIVGKEISGEQLEKILFETQVGKLIDRIYRLLGKRARSEKEIRDYLKNLSFKRKVKDQEELSKIVIESLIEKLKQKRLLNDEEFAKSWVEARSKKKGKIVLKEELLKKGVDREIIDRVLSSELGIQSKEVAQKLLGKRLPRWQDLPFLEKKKKSYEFLMRRGFEYSQVKEIVENILKNSYTNSK